MHAKFNEMFTEDMRRIAEEEGWNLFENHRGIGIERDDERGIFDTDEEAFDFVVRLADAGSRLHEIAVLIHAYGPIFDGVKVVSDCVGLLADHDDNEHDFGIRPVEGTVVLVEDNGNVHVSFPFPGREGSEGIAVFNSTQVYFGRIKPIEGDA